MGPFKNQREESSQQGQGSVIKEEWVAQLTSELEGFSIQGATVTSGVCPSDGSLKSRM